MVPPRVGACLGGSPAGGPWPGGLDRGLPRRLTKVPGTADRPVECAGEQHWRRPGNSIVLHRRLHRGRQRGGVQSSDGVFCGAVCHRSPPAQRRKDQGALGGLPAERGRRSPPTPNWMVWRKLARRERGGSWTVFIFFMCMFDSHSCPIHFINLAAMTPEFP